MYQMTLFKKKMKYKNCTIFSNFLGRACPQTPLAKGMASLSCGYICAAYCFDTCKFTFQKKNLDPLSNSVYSPGIHVQIN